MSTNHEKTIRENLQKLYDHLPEDLEKHSEKKKPSPSPPSERNAPLNPRESPFLERRIMAPGVFFFLSMPLVPIRKH